ncbi:MULTISPECIES: ABC transporter substrate-binding protein [unclassified Streptomyces]|uniref:ABC transporter substrate-binding protein n=1 Tax=Streptomyces TaxID=1883 RepID=UPI000BD58D4A|nr:MULTISPECIES: ABC transporter substrate-binding protein [unclassified Streptomyces]MDN3246027.1 ABC transporter substrate-binding protein [Streptomyces sp. ZSW22]MDN3254285.1 ABC transporter substrate-binding protein [Streptomyces sp. MA25(2023)]PAK26053.1 ABC transporter substrate-binding protein [Streptomyces sp. alain-838]
MRKQAVQVSTASARLTIGVVAPLTGRLAPLGKPLTYVLRASAPQLARVRHGNRHYDVTVAVRDSRSDPAAARQAVHDLVTTDQAHIVLTMAGTQVLPAVADACEELRVPCLSTTFPWQAYVHSRGADPGHAFRWTYHFAWGLDDIATVFARMWEQIDGPHTVGCLWNDDLQGSLLRHHEYGFTPVTSARGHTLTDLGSYTEPATDFEAQVGRMREHGVDIVTSAATATDLALFHQQARQSGLRPRLITCSRWLTYPHTHTTTTPGIHDELADARVATLVYWSPNHPYRSSLDGTTCADLAHAYQRDTGESWLQPLGLAHALVETAHHALTTADDPTDHAAVAHTLARTTLSTIAGTLDWKRGPTPNIALLGLAGGQWHPGPKGPSLTIVTNHDAPDVPVTGELRPT